VIIEPELELLRARSSRRCSSRGFERSSSLHNAYGYGLFTGGLGLHGGGERLGLNDPGVGGHDRVHAELRPDARKCVRGARSADRRRSDDMLIVRGVNVYPSQVGAALGRIPEISPHFGLVVRREGTLDTVEVLIEPAVDEPCDAVSVTARAAALIRETIGCSMTVKLVRPGEAPRSDGGKIQRVLDLR
jgi:phenylacetate-coenzyme A ligase PaaK-like adenylate-forming protein